ncbi:hypothetical protein NLV77_001868 [Staphylococcus ureilyticus]|uniref:hypothetical protein n=1 Tax=Staphylococcus ureilyticus TaxID=94138 RepID=UPI000D1C5941|nr:hypothetical protein [Staphylococcus ureilyticus]MDV3052928.1 hypothetical protein [Staphylococcus ureilyticus]PTF26648.1 hypothetical protein BUY19_10070 [Staphylococcus cohnii]
MEFNNWTVTINGKGSYNIVRDEDTLVILENYQHVALYLNLENDAIKVKSLSYGNDVSFNAVTREIIVNVINLLDDDD